MPSRQLQRLTLPRGGQPLTERVFASKWQNPSDKSLEKVSVVSGKPPYGGFRGVVMVNRLEACIRGILRRRPEGLCWHCSYNVNVYVRVYLFMYRQNIHTYIHTYIHIHCCILLVLAVHTLRTRLVCIYMFSSARIVFACFHMAIASLKVIRRLRVRPSKP